MDIPIPVDLGRIAQDLQIRRVQVESVVQLLDEGNTVPFITRYRKERTGNLNEVIIHEIQLRVQRLRELAERKETILKAIEAQGKLDPDLAAAIRAADNPKRLEDLYLPFKPKKRTKASDARERGLEPLALRIWTRDETLTDVRAAAEAFLDPEKGVDTVEKVLEGVGHILAEAISEMAMVRDAVRKVVWKTGKVVTTKSEIPDGQGLEFRDYFEYTEPVAQIPPHRVLAINRGDKEGPLKVKLEVSRPDVEAAMFSQLPLEGHPQHELFHGAAIDALDRLMLPSMEREVRRDLTEAAEKHAVEVFARNLGSLLLQPPIPKQAVLAIDPGFKNGCKVAVLDPGGQMVDHAVIYPHPPQNRRSEAKLTLKDMVGKHKVGVVAIGNGTACRETEELVAEIIAEGTRFSQGDGGMEPTEPGAAPDQEQRPAAEGEDQAAAPAASEGSASDAAAVATGPEAGSTAPEPETEAHAPSDQAPGESGEPDQPPADSHASAPEPAVDENHSEPAVATEHESQPAASLEPAHAEAEESLGNGSGGEPHAAHQPHDGPEPHPPAESPVEMLPPISGGAPEGDETEGGEGPTSGPDLTPPPAVVAAVTTESEAGAAGALEASSHQDEAPPASEPAAAFAHFPVPDDWEPQPEGDEPRSGPEAGTTTDPASFAASMSAESIAQEAAESGPVEPAAERAATGDHLPVPGSQASETQPEGVRRPREAPPRRPPRGRPWLLSPRPRAAAVRRARGSPQARGGPNGDAGRATASHLRRPSRPSRLGRTPPTPSLPSSPTSSSTRPAPACTRPARSAATSCPNSTRRSAVRSRSADGSRTRSRSW